MNRISRNISIILRAEWLIARHHLAVLRNQTGRLDFAALVAGIGLIMLNVAAFYRLARKQSAKTELEPLTGVRDLEVELQGVVTEARELKDNVRRIARGPMRTALPAMLIPLLTSQLRHMGKPGAK